MKFQSYFLAIAIAFLSLTQMAAAGAFITNGPLNVARSTHTATLLHNGKLLVAGGGTNMVYGSLSGAELYDPATGTWAETGLLAFARFGQSTTMLPNGKVLVAGGADTNSVSLASAEVFDSSTGVWSQVGAMNTPRMYFTVKLLLNGQVLIAGGINYSESNSVGEVLSSCELFDPATGVWTNTGSLSVARQNHTATLLQNGQVLVAGGFDMHVVGISELYDPVTGIWTPTNSMVDPRAVHCATMLPGGTVLAAGGVEQSPFFTYPPNAEIFDPAIGTWASTSNLTVGHYLGSASLLPDGVVLVEGGEGPGNPSITAESYNPITKVWTLESMLNTARQAHTSTVLANGKVILAGGADGGDAGTTSTELFDPAIAPATGTWTNSGSLTTNRAAQTATLLPNGKVLIAGGVDINTADSLSSAELYDPLTSICTSIAPMTTNRWWHTATLLPNGKVLAVGGVGVGGCIGYLSTAEVYDPAKGTWTPAGAMSTYRVLHTATLLPNGKVLIAGGQGDTNQCTIRNLSSAELFDPASGQWAATGAMNDAHEEHTATLLPNGLVLIAGGGGGFVGISSSAELFDPATGRWAVTGTMHDAREDHTATLLPSGKVLVAGGAGVSNYLSSAELYDPATRSWTSTGAMITARGNHKATLLPNGKVLVAGGDTGGALTNAELYDPATGVWTACGPLNSASSLHTATLLLNGKVFLAGGFDDTGGSVSGIELFDTGQGFSNAWQPQITSVTSPLNLANSLTVNGSQFRGISEGSSGNFQDSSTDYPLVQLRSIESGQSIFLGCTNWSATSFSSVPVTNFPPGFALATVFVNGIPSASSIVNISVPVPVAATLTNLQVLTNGAFRFSFSNTPGALFGVLTTTNPALPLTNWTLLGGVAEISPGQFQFTAPLPADGPRRFYRLRAP